MRRTKNPSAFNWQIAHYLSINNNLLTTAEVDNANVLKILWCQHSYTKNLKFEIFIIYISSIRSSNNFEFPNIIIKFCLQCNRLRHWNAIDRDMIHMNFYRLWLLLSLLNKAIITMFKAMWVFFIGSNGWFPWSLLTNNSVVQQCVFSLMTNKITTSVRRAFIRNLVEQ